MLQLLRLLLYLAAGAVIYAPSIQSTYYESAPSCGYTATEFVHFEQNPELLKDPYLGVCGVGINNISQLRPRTKSCVSCTFTPAVNPVCGKSATLVQEPVWYLAPQQKCQWQGSFLGCSNGIVASKARLDDGSFNENCCPIEPYIRCCTLVDCIWRSSPSGQCVAGEKDLLPRQQFTSLTFAVSAASNCSHYSFLTPRVCQANRTFAALPYESCSASNTVSSDSEVCQTNCVVVPPLAYESCSVPETVSRDVNGCVKLPGYIFHQARFVSDSDHWRIDDGTPWNMLSNCSGARQEAARDMVLMASRCSALATCAGFQSTGGSTDLLYQIPISSSWKEVNQSSETSCYGIYEKSPPQSSCPRISGYLFIPQRTLDPSAVTDFIPSAMSCSKCSNNTALAKECSAGSTCAGFSNYHGLLTRSGASNSLLSDAPMIQFTRTPCAGMFVRTGQEVEQLDRLLCGALVYCSTSQIRYHASNESSVYVNLTLDIFTDLVVPRSLQDARGGGLQQLPAVRSLTFRCHDGSTLLGGLPVGLAVLTPFLQELRVQGCRTSGGLPPELAQLRYLRVLDLGNNNLAGSVPADWGSMKLGYLNLSNNALTGTLPVSWRGVVIGQGAAALPPLPETVLSPANRRRAVQATLLTSTEGQSQSGMLVADLRNNWLEGPVDRGFVYDSCVKNNLRMQLRGEQSSVSPTGSDVATFLLQDNPGIAAWAGSYSRADPGGGSGSSNLCGAYGYKIALGLLWGVFGVCLVAIASWSAFLAWKAARAARRGRFFIADMGGPATGDAAASMGPDAGGDRCAAACACAVTTVSLAGRASDGVVQLWRKRWVRRVTLLARIGYLAADIALDIRVTVWLFNDGDSSSAAVCLAFLVATHVVISAAVVASLAHHFFSSRLLVAFLSPLLLAMGPIVGPVLAVANIRNSDVPLVFWRYLELVEFCVALLQAPAESVTQSVVYARLNQLGNGMYMDHGIFVTSILLSLGDILIAAAKLCRYKRGPLRRVLVALTYLDRVRDPVDYQKPLISGDMDYGTEEYGTGAGGLVAHYLDTPLNPPADADGRRSPTAANPSAFPRTTAGPLPMSPPGGGAGGDVSSTPVLELSLQEQLSPVDEARAAATATAAMAPHTFTPLTAPRYRPSLLAASSQRLGGGSHATGVPSRLGPGGSVRSATVTISTQPPLRPSQAHLPVTPTVSERIGSGKSEATSSAQARGWSAAGAETTSVPEHAGVADGSLNRRSRSLQPPLQTESITPQHAFAGINSSELYGSAATGGHGPPPPSSTTGTQEMSRLASGSNGAATQSTSTATDSAVTAIAAVPPLSPSVDPRYLPSAAAAAKAVLAEITRPAEPPPPQPVSSILRGPALGVASDPPERLGLGLPVRSSSISARGQRSEGVGASPTARSLRQVSSLASASRSAQGSPARRREGPVLSIAVPASPVHAQGIEVIRMSTPSSARHLSPQSSRGAPTPVSMLPPPPQLRAVQEQEPSMSVPPPPSGPTQG
ncbi:hypothetical protein Vretimale_8191 [Volvox reticuliferus]|uniref:Uncharacterized protein n=1 Tax=Volvox reticuliferus TaxID=1737510 RepID=A0A8J4LP70_9CHLO|nr:hypothetical protein Vretifemale_11747 [Volvox reticuliferus]GIM03652.1 hypothetical protein Vretimale_8191 [Volvox reticuliferus]